MEAEIAAILAQLQAAYSPLSPAAQAALREVAQPLMTQRGQMLVQEGQRADCTYFLVKGCARAYYLREGRDITDWFAFEGEFIAPIHSYFLEVPSPQYLETLEPAFLLQIRRGDALRLCDAFPDFDRFTRVVVTHTLLKLQQRVYDMQFQTAQQRYESLLEHRPDMPLRVPLGHIASYLGITLETLSRIRSQSRTNLT